MRTGAIFPSLTILILLVLTPLTSRALTIEPVTSGGGITAWLMRDTSLPLVAIDFAFLGAGGLRIPPRCGPRKIDGQHTLMRGQQMWDSQAFQAKINASSGLSFDVSSDDFHGRLYSLTRYIDLASDLMQAALSQPRFDEEPVARMRAQLSSRAKRRLCAPRPLLTGIYGKAITHRIHIMAQFLAMRKRWLPFHPPIYVSAGKTDLARENLIVSVVGDMTPATLKASYWINYLGLYQNRPICPKFSAKICLLWQF